MIYESHFTRRNKNRNIFKGMKSISLSLAEVVITILNRSDNAVGYMRCQQQITAAQGI